MSCDCEQYINCNDSQIEVATYDEATSYSHEYNNLISSDDVLEFYQKTVRSFSVQHSWDRDITPGFILSGCMLDNSMYSCDQLASATPSSSVSESCMREVNVPYYWDRQRGIYVWKHVREELVFSVVSNKAAVFRTKWGNTPFHKICITSNVKTSGVEQFVMVKGGEKVILAEVAYQYNPFPQIEGGGTTWGLYGNQITRAASPDTEDVVCILLFPNVPKLAIPYDNDVIHYGFYDYNVIEGGFTESSLPKDDGGKDYFYPYWCRSMPTDPIWRQTADQRYDVIYSKGTMDLSGTTAWTPPEPEVFPWPFGSFALDSKGNFVASCLLQFGQHADSKGVVYNEASIGDLFAAVKKTGAPLNGRFSALFPVTPV